MGGTLGGHDAACMLARYALAAKKQGNFWGATSVLYDKQPQTVEQIMEEFDKAHLNLDNNQLKSDANSPVIAQELRDEIEQANQEGVHGTPCIEVNGHKNMGLIPYDDLIKQIKDERKRLELDEKQVKVQQQNEQENQNQAAKKENKLYSLIKKITKKN